MIFYTLFEGTCVYLPKRFINRPEYALSGSHSTLSFRSTDRSEN